MQSTQRELTRKLVITAIFGAIGFILMVLEFSTPIIPEFVKLDFSELPALITSFSLGPWWGVAVCLIKNLLHLSVSTSHGVGELSNFILGAVFIATAGLIYQRKKTRSYALLGSFIGAVAMAVISVFSNYFIVYPFYSMLFKLPMEAIVGMYTAILPPVKDLVSALLIFNLPFTFCKCMISVGITFACYKQLSPILKGKKK